MPWERVFVNQDVRTQFAQWHRHAGALVPELPGRDPADGEAAGFWSGSHAGVAETIGTIAFPQVVETLGRLSSQLQVIEAFVLAMEVKGWRYGEYWLPDRELLYASQVQSQALYPEIVHTIRELAGGGMIMVPSSVEDFADPELASLIGSDPVLAGDGLQGQGQAVQACVGRHRLGVRLAPHAVRDVLLGAEGGHHRHRVSHLRLGSGDRTSWIGAWRATICRKARTRPAPPQDGRDST